MNRVKITIYTILMLVFGVCFTPKVSFSAKPSSDHISEPNNRNTLPPKDTAQIVSDLYAKAIMIEEIEESNASTIISTTSLYLKCLELNPNHAPSLYMLSRHQLYTNLEKSLDYITRAIEIDSTEIAYKQFLLTIYSYSQNYDADKVLDLIGQINDINPDLQQNYLTTSIIYLQKDMPYAAITVLDSAQNRFGRSYEFSSQKLDILMSLNLMDRATEEAATLASEFPTDTETLRKLAELYAQQGKDSLAMDSYNKALRVNPEEVNILLSMCNYYANIKNDTKAFLNTIFKLMEIKSFDVKSKIEIFDYHIKKRELYQQYLFEVNNIASTITNIHPESIEATQLYVSHLLAIGKLDQASDIYKRMLETDNSLHIYKSIIELETYANRVDSVDKYSAMALESYPKNCSLYLQRASVHQYMGNNEMAIAELSKAVKYAENDSIASTIYGYMGDIYQTMGENKKSINSYKKALKYDSLNVLVLNNYSYYLSVYDRNLNLALEMSSKVNELEPNNPTYLDTQAWILYKLGEYEQAQTFMRLAISLDRGSSNELYIHYGDILYALGQEFMATTYWQKAIDNGYTDFNIDEHIKQLESKKK